MQDFLRSSLHCKKDYAVNLDSKESLVALSFFVTFHNDVKATETFCFSDLRDLEINNPTQHSHPPSPNCVGCMFQNPFVSNCSYGVGLFYKQINVHQPKWKWHVSQGSFRNLKVRDLSPHPVQSVQSTTQQYQPLTSPSLSFLLPSGKGGGGGEMELNRWVKSGRKRES